MVYEITSSLSGNLSSGATSTRFNQNIKLADASRLHVVLALLLIELTLFLCGGILVLLILRHKIVHVGLRFRKFHFVHALSSIPMQKCFAPEHGREVFGYTFEHFLNCGRISSESDSHLQTFRGNVADARFDVVRYPFYEI